MRAIGMTLVGAIGIALVITALTLEGRQTPQVIDSFAGGTSRVIESSLGFTPSGRRR